MMVQFQVIMVLAISDYNNSNNYTKFYTNSKSLEIHAIHMYKLPFNADSLLFNRLVENNRSLFTAYEFWTET